MKYIGLVLCFLVGLLSNANASTVTGCESPVSPYNIYITQNGSFNDVPNFDFSSDADKASGPMYCKAYSGTNSCWINAIGSPSTSKYGTLVTFNTVNSCPLDENLFLLLPITAIMGFFWIQRKWNLTIG